jgi:hypothetical protein
MIVHLMAAVILLPARTHTAPVAGSSPSTTRRWFYPCNGAVPDIVEASGFVEGDSSEMDVTHAELADSFHTLSTKATRLKRHVRDLKDLYVCINLKCST